MLFVVCRPTGERQDLVWCLDFHPSLNNKNWNNV